MSSERHHRQASTIVSDFENTNLKGGGIIPPPFFMAGASGSTPILARVPLVPKSQLRNSGSFLLPAIGDRKPLILWGIPRHCRGGSKSLTDPGVHWDRSQVRLSLASNPFAIDRNRNRDRNRYRASEGKNRWRLPIAMPIPIPIPPTLFQPLWA